MPLHKLRSSMSILPQTPYIFPSSLKLNFDPLNILSEDQILGKLPSFILDSLKPLTMESQVSDNNLSLCQKQIICLARVLLEKQ